MQPILIGIGIYLFVQFALGMAVSRKIASESDYLVAGRQLGAGLAAFSIFATWFGAETVVGAAGAIYSHGLSAGSADPFGRRAGRVAHGHCPRLADAVRRSAGGGTASLPRGRGVAPARTRECAFLTLG